MYRKALTNLIILALTVLPVQVISAGIENSNMQMKMSLVKVNQTESDCMHKQSVEQASEKSCCDEHANQCKSCNNCPQVASATVLTAPYQMMHLVFNKKVLFTSHLLLNGVPQNNLLRPPRTII